MTAVGSLDVVLIKASGERIYYGTVGYRVIVPVRPCGAMSVQ